MPAALRFEVFTLFPEVFEPYLQTSILQTRPPARTDRSPAAQYPRLDHRPPPHHRRRALRRRRRHGDETRANLYGGRERAGRAADLPADPAHPPGTHLYARHGPPAGWPRKRWRLARPAALALLCGRYEGVDERVRQHLVTDEISIGDYVLTGGELAALVVIDAISRWHAPGVLGDPDGVHGRLARLRTAGVPALHPSGRIPRLACARYLALRRPRPPGALAPGAVPAAHLAPPPRSFAKRAAQ